MPKLKPNTILPTASEDAVITKAAFADPDTLHPSEENLQKFKKEATLRGQSLENDQHAPPNPP